MTLSDALAQVELEEGRSYDCVVNGKRVTVEVAPACVTKPAFGLNESDVMLDAWCDLPSQGTSAVVRVVPRRITMPDIPSIPGDDE